MVKEPWVVPGAPLQSGDGWRLWYSFPGTADPRRPAPPVVDGAPARIDGWELLPRLEALDRRIGILTVRARRPAAGARTVRIPEHRPDGPAFRWRTLPQSIEEGVTFLLASCFYLGEGKSGHYLDVMRTLHAKRAPAFKLLMGDQLYVDVPVLRQGHTPHDRYARQYPRYWGHDAYQPVLQASPNLFTSDDHEFWNNFPEISWNVWSVFSRDEATRAGRDFLHHFQHAVHPQGRRAFSLDIGPVSLFVTDTRSRRTKQGGDDEHAFDREQRTALERWFKELRGPGLLALAQPLFKKPGGPTDYALGNFEADQAWLMGLFDGALKGDTGDGRPHDVAILSGDIHTGRHAVASLGGRAGALVHELVASPAARVPIPFRGGRDKAQLPPRSLHGAPLPWRVRVTETTGAPTVADNVGVVQLDPGTNGRVRATFELHRVRPYDTRGEIARRLDRPRPEGPHRVLLRTETQLR